MIRIRRLYDSTCIIRTYSPGRFGHNLDKYDAYGSRSWWAGGMCCAVASNAKVRRPCTSAAPTIGTRSAARRSPPRSARGRRTTDLKSRLSCFLLTPRVHELPKQCALTIFAIPTGPLGPHSLHRSQH